MKTLKYLGMALLSMALCVNFSACSDDDDDKGGESGFQSDLTGTWKCVSQTGGDNEYKFIEGDYIRFFASDYAEEEDYPEVTGKNADIYWNGGWRREGDSGCTLEEFLNAPDPGEEGSLAYTLKSRTLTLMESDLDRWTGTVAMDKDGVMTFTYTYQNWNADSRKMKEEFGPFTAKFQKQ